MAAIRACVIDSHSGIRVDAWLSALYPQLSRGAVKRWIDAGVSVDDKRVKPSAKVVTGQVVCWTPQFEAMVDVDQAQDLKLDVVYVDEDVLILNKAAGMVMHPAAGHGSGTLLNALLHHYPQTQALPRAGIVHRLDKDTSGLVVVALNMMAHQSLIEQLQRREAKRQYSAVVCGPLVSGGEVDAPIGRHPVDRKRRAVREDGKTAITEYRVKQRFRAHTWLELSLKTGRTHQIRVHMSSLRHSLVGDRVYGYQGRGLNQASDALNSLLRNFGRQALHAQALGFSHPADGRAMHFTAEIPNDIQQLIDALEADSHVHASLD